MLTTLANQYQAASMGWMNSALTYALHLFYLLVAIEIAVFAFYHLFQKDGLADFFAALLIKLLSVLFFWVLLQEAPVWIPTIIQSFTQAGAVIGNTNNLDPSSVFAQGVTVATVMLTSINDTSLFSAFLLIVIAGLCAVGIVLAYAVIAAQLMITLIDGLRFNNTGHILNNCQALSYAEGQRAGFRAAANDLKVLEEQEIERR